MNKLYETSIYMLLAFVFLALLFSCEKDSDVFYETVQEEISKNNSEENTIIEGSNGEDTPNIDDTISTDLKAFPSAFGAGAYVTGGRGKPVYKVTNLNDSGSGSFRQALTDANKTDGGIIVFEVSGTIDLKSWLTISTNNLTIAGQTAPEGGITITGTRFRADRCNNVIMRYIRIRPTYTGEDTFEWISCHDIIVDHVSATWGGDEAFSTRAYTGQPVYNFTIQNMIIAESKTGSLFGDSTNPSLAWDLSFHNSLFFNISHRVPNINASGRADVINNVTWDWQARLTFVNGDSQLNHMNNYYGGGSRNSLGKSRNTASTSYSHSIYSAGNYIDKNIFTDLTAKNESLWVEFNGGQQDAPLSSDNFTNTPHDLLGAPLQVLPANEAFTKVINDAGCNKYIDDNGNVVVKWDFIDAEYLAIINQGEGSYDSYENSPETFTSERRYIDFHNSVSATPWATRNADYDKDNDGMADIWEIAYGLNPNIDDSNGDKDEDGYTNIEEFINMVDVN
ncbi:hypothetical protein [Flagellimonas nanhaiensis]|uniref:Pectate lyase n=1 Tax=Flagellimonas nanhaiensis TaxID=2292706 RepID=A0A371JKX3_9FLAO|nr:hypothetical protein [Allomuricauda nanhaiensis]RDY57603.1 hypothetical protein DX873_18520 [Allomuricauda nanhaiensis]